MSTSAKSLGLWSLALAVFVVILACGAIGVTGVAAQSAIPGDTLYPVKTSTERARLGLARDAGRRAELKMEFAQERLDEIAVLVAEGRYGQVNQTVLAFEANMNSAILELEALARVDPARAAGLALEVTAALTRYAQTLSILAAGAPDAVKPFIDRALDSTRTAGNLELPSDNTNTNTNDNSNANTNSNENANDNGNDNGNGNSNGNTNANDNSNTNSNANTNNNTNGDDGNGNGNGNGNANDDDDDDDDNRNGNDDNGNDDD